MKGWHVRWYICRVVKLLTSELITNRFIKASEDESL